MVSMHFVDRSAVRSLLEGRRVAVVGGGPSAAANPPGLVDAYDVVVRVNNYRLGGGSGRRCDVFHSYFGNAIRKTPDELRRAGVKLCMAKCPDAHAIQSDWHRKNGQMHGVDFRWIYRKRRDWWFCDTYVPTVAEFLEGFDLLGGHVPTTGFAAILDVLACAPARLYLTGFDGFRSGLSEGGARRWDRHGKNPDDPVRHEPEREMAWLSENLDRHPIEVDAALREALDIASRDERARAPIAPAGRGNSTAAGGRQLEVRA